jgi:hypothetical protein
VVLTTVRWHSRSRAHVVARYRASVSRARSALAPGIVPFRIKGAEETIFWLPRARTLIPGDRIIGSESGGLRVCPQSWLDYLHSGITVADVQVALRPLLGLSIERVLVSHGHPVLTGGRRALDRALDSATR